ncbi:MAG: hypothetical protein Q9197_001332 [Variospora fuerteventurae]
MVVVKKAQQGLRKWEELLAEAQTTLQERTRNVGHVRERVAREQALRASIVRSSFTIWA